MSDFDKEAEREKLREKYERDRRDREATQHMSDLLLKGATMTNTHCDVCSDPLFRHQGTTFCPSCHGGPEGVEASVESGSPDAGGEPPGEAESPRAETADVGGTDGQGDGDEGMSGSMTSAAGGQADRTQGGDAAPAQVRPNGAAVAGRPADGSTPNRPTPPATGGTTGGEDRDLDSATEALVAAPERFSRAAAETDDPRHAKACLEAAHEAARTLETVR